MFYIAICSIPAKYLRTLSSLFSPNLIDQSSSRILTRHAKTRPVLHDDWLIKLGENRPDRALKHLAAVPLYANSNEPFAILLKRKHLKNLISSMDPLHLLFHLIPDLACIRLPYPFHSLITPLSTAVELGFLLLSCIVLQRRASLSTSELNLKLLTFPFVSCNRYLVS